MIELCRTIRFSINPDSGPGSGHPDSNGYGGVPAMSGLGRYYEVDVVCSGEPDGQSGYLVDIRDLDRAARSAIIPRIAAACRDTPLLNPQDLLPVLLGRLALEFEPLRGRLIRLRWRLTPTYSVEMSAATSSIALLRQQFDFAAAHRLHVAELSDQQNRDLFGKCNNPAGHGHNYHLEPAVEVTLSPGGSAFALRDLELLTEEVLIQRFDHTHLNQDTKEFGPGGVNPSVENIAKVFFELLAPAVQARSGGRASLKSMTVWETAKTSATYPG